MSTKPGHTAKLVPPTNMIVRMVGPKASACCKCSTSCCCWRNCFCTCAPSRNVRNLHRNRNVSSFVCLYAKILASFLTVFFSTGVRLWTPRVYPHLLKLLKRITMLFPLLVARGSGRYCGDSTRQSFDGKGSEQQIYLQSVLLSLSEGHWHRPCTTAASFSSQDEMIGHGIVSMLRKYSAVPSSLESLVLHGTCS